ncbi:MAG: hypothetical protein JSS20_16825, partial [Proteobacteria bacterium]|nr:hypothetical protein [Pseudomonadota bacterium]
FATDVLSYLNALRAVVIDVPIRSHYGDETSGLKISSVVIPFLFLHITKFVRRILSQYFVRDFNFGSLCLVVGLPTLLFGLIHGANTWWHASLTGKATPIGTVMLVALSVIMGTQLILTFFSADIAGVPRTPIHRLLAVRTLRPLEQFVKSKECEDPSETTKQLCTRRRTSSSAAASSAAQTGPPSPR